MTFFILCRHLTFNLIVKCIIAYIFAFVKRVRKYGGAPSDTEHSVFVIFHALQGVI